MFQQGDIDSPGPAGYNIDIATKNMESNKWFRSKLNSNFNRQKRSIDLEERSLEDRALLPGPNHYTNLKEVLLSKQQINYGSRFSKAQRKTFFDAIEKKQEQMPGPANYERKRMFDNKQAIDYTKRFQTSMQIAYNTTSVDFPPH